MQRSFVKCLHPDVVVRFLVVRYSGPRAMEVINGVSERLGGASIVATSVVPDSVEAIQEVLKRWSDVDRVNLILTTGMPPMSLAPFSLAAISFSFYLGREPIPMAFSCLDGFHY